jgi:glycosyltransferase involved in cell wall biosynthesis
MPLLSIIIPTKNRQMTALFAVKTALAIPSDDIEIIVQDCSEENSLKFQLDTLNDSRIKYYFQNDSISMTENWNRAYSHASGDYQIGIGDDDGVLPDILQVVKWAKSNELEAVGQTEPYHYFWSNFPVYHLKNRLLIKPFSGNILPKVDLYQTVLKRSKLCDDGYSIDLPMIYHRLISKKLIDKLKEVTGKFLDGTALDVYSSFALGLLCKDFTILDYPFSLRGASGQSNSGRFVVKKDKQHFDEFKYINYPDWLPKIPYVQVSIAESIYRAFLNTGNESLVSNIDKKFLYANCLLERPEEKKHILEFVDKHLNEAERSEMFQLISDIKKKKFLYNFLVSLETVDRYIPVVRIYRKLIGKKIIKLSDSMAVLEYHKNYVTKNNIKLNIPDNIKTIPV